MPKELFVTGTDTNVGKTVLAALLCAALDAVYWKPIQTGLIEGTDRRTVMRWAEIPESQTRDESFIFQPPVSPHLAARQAHVRIDLSRIRKPLLPAGALLVVEGAGGALVPINECEFMTDLMRHLQAPVVVAARSTLGTINHTLLTLTALRASNIQIAGVVVIGERNQENREAIETYGCTPIIGEIPPLRTINRQSLRDVYATYFDPKAFADD